jgi:hypothetical protein
MRTTLTLEPDVFAAARKLAEARSESLGKVVSDLIRRGLEAEPPVKSRSGFPVFKVPRTASPLTLADVKLDEDEG